ncbi:MAG: helix-turn-helix transcriptional regulator [Acidimicrobiales bacterium]
MTARRKATAGKPLLSIEETAILLGETRSTLYRAVKAGTLPLPVFVIGGRYRVPRAAVERLVAGLSPIPDDDWEPQPGAEDAVAAPPRSRPTCSAARRSSAGKPSV